MAEGAAAQGVKRYPRDLLRQFSGGVRQVEPLAAAFAAATEEEDSGEIELSLGLSLGGCFGVDPARRSGLHRSSSVAAIPILQQGEGDPGDLTLLKRTSSLPAEAEEEQRKRRELQCLRRMEAKRRRSEKVGGAWEGDGGTGWVERPEIGWWVPPNASAAAAEGARGFAPASQGSVGSQGSSSSGASDFGGRPPNQEELLGNGTDQWRNPSRTQSLPALTEHNLPAVGKTMNYAASREEVVNSSPQKESALAATNGGDGVMEEMPWVSTKGGDPNGRKVEGFLYRYGKGREVRIVCICHGHFLSPAEFVRHAGGGDVTHPLKHIMVSTSPSSFL